MDKKLKVIAIVAIIAFVSVLPLSAQNYKLDPIFDGPTSNTNRATAGIFGTEVDDMMDVNAFGDVEFEKGFGFAHGYNYEPTQGDWPFVIDLGYATTVGGMYLGTRYTGNIVNVEKDVSETLIATWNIGGNNEVTQEVKTFTGTRDWTNTTNQLEVLLGISGMGIKVGFFQSLAIAGKMGPETIIDSYDGIVSYYNMIDSYDRRGWLSPYLGFGINIGGGESMLISPYILAAFNIKQDEAVTKTQNYFTFNGQRVGDTGFTATGGRNEGFISPDITVGSWFTLPSSGTSTTSFGIEYNLALRMYDNDFSDSGFPGSVKGLITSFSGSKTETKTIQYTEIEENGVIEYTENSYMSHTIVPSFKIVNELESLKYGLGISVPVSITLDNSKEFKDTYNRETIRSHSTDNLWKTSVYYQRNREIGNSVDITELSINPEINFGASYTVNERFTVNAGIAARPIGFTNTVTRTQNKGVQEITYEESKIDGKVVYQDTSVVYGNTTFDNIQTELDIASFAGNATAGFVFNFTEKMALDFLVGLEFGWWDPSGTGNWFVPRQSSTESFSIDLAKVNILFTMKF